MAAPDFDLAQETPRALKARLRKVRAADLAAVVAIDAEVTRLPKPGYWARIYRRYAGARRQPRFFLVAEVAGRIDGFVVGEVRDWEFGAPRCGWVFAISVRPRARLSGIGSRLLQAICQGFRRLGVRKVRTMLARDNPLVLSFFRSQGMTAAPLIPLEIDLGAARGARR